MQKYKFNPNLSSHEQLFGIFNFNFTPCVQPVKRILVHEKPENRATYASHESCGWYIGIEPLHYRCFKYYMTSPKTYRTSDTFDFFPQHFSCPKISSADEVSISELQLILPKKSNTVITIQSWRTWTRFHKKISENFKCAVQTTKNQRPNQGNQFPRVQKFTQPVLMVVRDTTQVLRV